MNQEKLGSAPNQLIITSQLCQLIRRLDVGQQVYVCLVIGCFLFIHCS